MRGTQDPKVTRPAHYVYEGIEVIDFLKAVLTPEEFQGFCKGMVIKYQARASRKNKEADHAKACWYARFLIGDDPRKDVVK